MNGYQTHKIKLKKKTEKKTINLLQKEADS